MMLSFSRRDAMALLCAILLGYGAGCLIAAVPRAYALIWWLAAGSIAWIVGSLAQHGRCKVGAALLLNSSIFLAFAQRDGLMLLSRVFFHSANLDAASRRMLLGEVLGTFIGAQIFALAVTWLAGSHATKAERPLK